MVEDIWPYLRTSPVKTREQIHYFKNHLSVFPLMAAPLRHIMIYYEIIIIIVVVFSAIQKPKEQQVQERLPS